MPKTLLIDPNIDDLPWLWELSAADDESAYALSCYWPSAY